MNDDLISRSALCEKLQAHKDFFVNAWGGFGNLPPKDKARVDEITHCIAETMNAPAVDADMYYEKMLLVKEAFEIAKSGLGPVVRCENCRYIRPEVDAFTHEVVGHWCSLLDIGSVEYDHFCSYGERRSDE